MDRSVLVCCGPPKSTVGAATGGLRCRMPSGREVDAAWDDERAQLTCSVDKEEYSASCVPRFAFEVVDASGATLWRGAGTKDALRDDCGRAADAAASRGTLEVQQGDSSVPSAGGGAPPPQGAREGRRASAVMSGLSWLDRLLPVWIVAAMVLGVLIGSFVPSARSALSVLHVDGVSLPIALGLWLMMWPVLTKVQYELLWRLLNTRAAAKQFGVSFVMNWLLGPALMTGLAWMCLPDLPGFRNGVILVGLARCIAMVLVWNQLADGDPELCAVMVAFNSVLQIILYAPLSVFYLQVVSGSKSTVSMQFGAVAKSVLLFLGVPLVAGILLRVALIAAKSKEWFASRFMPRFGPLALLGLLYTIVIMFASQDIVGQIASVARVAVPMLIYFLTMFGASLAASWYCCMPYGAAATQAFTAASNNFELAIAIAVATFGVSSQEALAATVGPLIEVPVLLALVHVSLAAKRRLWDRAAAA